MPFSRKYATTLSGGTKIRIPMPKAGSNDFAGSGDWTPAAGDVKVSIDGGAEANIGTLPSFSNGLWEYILSSTELTGKSIAVKIVDSATKAVDDNAFLVETFGNASAMYPDDISSGSASPPTNWALLVIGSDGVVKANLVQILATALTETAGQIAAAFKQFFNIASPTSTMNNITSVSSVSGSVGSVTGAVGSVTGSVGGSVASVTGNVGGNVVGSVGSVTGAVGSVAGNVGGTVNDLASTAAATVKTQVVAALTTDTYAEPSSVPAATSSIKDMLHWVFTKARNKRTTTASADVVRNDGDTANISSATLGDDGTTFTKGKDA